MSSQTAVEQETDESECTENLTVSMSADMKREIQRLAKASERSASAFVRMHIKSALRPMQDSAP